MVLPLYNLVEERPDLGPVRLHVPLQELLLHVGELPGRHVLPALVDSLPLAGEHVQQALLQAGNTSD